MNSSRGKEAAPTVSVVMPLYNKIGYVEAAIRSVLEQTFADLELVIIDDGSTDGSAAVVQEMTDQRIRLLRQENAGAAAARNAGIAAVQGRWVAFLDADDTWRPDKLARQLAILKREPNLVWAAGAYIRNLPGRIALERNLSDDAWFRRPEVLKDGLLALAHESFLWTGTILVRRDVLLALGGFDPALHTGEDVLLWARIGARYPALAYVRTPIASYEYMLTGSLSEEQGRPGATCIPYLACRLLAISRTLPAPRAAALWRAAEGQLVQHAKRQILAGYWSSARATVAEAERLTPSPQVKRLRRLVALPAWPTLLACRWAMRLSQSARQALRFLSTEVAPSRAGHGTEGARESSL